MEPATSRSAVTRSTDWANTAVVKKSEISPDFLVGTPVVEGTTLVEDTSVTGTVRTEEIPYTPKT